MTRYEELNEFFDNMFTHHFDELVNSENYKYRIMRQEYINEMLKSNLNHDQQEFIDEILYEIHLSAERDAKMYYEQGINDGIWMLKQLGVLA